MGSKKWNVRVWCLIASYNYKEVAQDRETAIENVRARVMPDMRGWNFSATVDDEENDNQ